LKLKEANHSMFYSHTSLRKCVYLIVYVDDIVITGNYITKIAQVEKHLFSHFPTKDIGYLKHFLSIEVVQSKGVIILNQKLMRD